MIQYCNIRAFLQNENENSAFHFSYEIERWEELWKWEKKKCCVVNNNVPEREISIWQIDARAHVHVCGVIRS